MFLKTTVVNSSRTETERDEIPRRGGENVVVGKQLKRIEKNEMVMVSNDPKAGSDGLNHVNEEKMRL